MTKFDPTNPTPEQVADYEAYLERHGLTNDLAARRAAAAQQRHDRAVVPVEEWKGLRLSVYRAAGLNCTNGGVTAEADYVTVVGIKRPGSGALRQLPAQARVFPADPTAPAVVLVESNLPGMYGPHLEPLEVAGPDRVGPMMGGNYVAGSDSRWGELGELFGHGRLGAVPVHDRFETVAQYRALSMD